MDKDREGVVSSAMETAEAGLESAKDLAVSAGTAVGEAVSSLAKKARKPVRHKRPSKRKSAPASKREREERCREDPPSGYAKDARQEGSSQASSATERSQSAAAFVRKKFPEPVKAQPLSRLCW